MGYEDLDDEAVRIDAATERVEPEEDIPEVAVAILRRYREGREGRTMLEPTSPTPYEIPEMDRLSLPDCNLVSKQRCNVFCLETNSYWV